MICKKIKIFVFLIMNTVIISHAKWVFAADEMEKYIPKTETAENGMTMWETMRSGGGVMILLAFLSVAGLGLIIYYFLTMKTERLLPKKFLEKVLAVLEKKRTQEARMLCSSNNNLIANIVETGLSHVGRDQEVIKEAIQDEGRRSIEDLRQKLSYLADIAAIAPMVGLLGTVLGMIQAFNVIAFQAGAVKPVLLASGISKAMVTTATGLIIAIPAMIFYSYFRGKIRDIVSRMEDISTEIYHLIAEKSGT